MTLAKTECRLAARGTPFVAAIVACLALFGAPATTAGWTGLEAPARALVPHTQLEESRPADGAVLTERPVEIWLRYSTAVQRGLSQARLFLADGSEVGLSAIAWVEGSNETELRAAITTALAPGSYTLEWSTAGPDSHIIEGTVAFVLDVPPAPIEVQDSVAPATSGEAGDQGEPEASATGIASASGQASGDDSGLAQATAELGLAARWLGFLGSILLVGVATFHFVVVGGAKRRGEAEAVASFLPRLRGYTYVVTTLALAATILRLVDGGVTFGAGRLGPLLFGSPWGLSWWLYGVGAIAALVGVRMAGKAGNRAVGWRLVTLGAVVTAISMPFAGHGWATATRVIAAPTHVLHTLGAGLWMGSLGVLVVVALPFLSKRRDSEGRSPEASAWVASFSKVALVGVGVLLVTGAVNTWQHVGAFGALFGSAYGRTLLIKVGILGGALLLGLYNWKQARPALDETGKPGLIRLPATIELVLGLAVLLATAVLVAMHLPV